MGMDDGTDRVIPEIARPWLIFRWHYSVQEVWGPFWDEQIALEFLKALLIENPARVESEFSVKQIDHLEGSVIEMVLLACKWADTGTVKASAIIKMLGGKVSERL